MPAGAEPPLDYQPPPPDPPGAARLDHPRPGQMEGNILPPLSGVAPFFRLPSIDESPPVVLASLKKPYWQAGLFDPVLTDACRLAEFASLPLNRIVAVFSGDPKAKASAPDQESGRGVLQVVLPDRRFLLVDSGKLAKPGETYYFKDSGQPSCQVWIKGGKPRRLDPVRGTSVPPLPANALKQRQALIKSWPQHQ